MRIEIAQLACSSTAEPGYQRYRTTVDFRLHVCIFITFYTLRAVRAGTARLV